VIIRLGSVRIPHFDSNARGSSDQWVIARGSSPVAPPWKTNSQPTSPELSEDGDDDDDDETPLAFDLDAQIQQALTGPAAPADNDNPKVSNDTQDHSQERNELANQNATALAVQQSEKQHSDSDSDNDSDMDAPFDFNAHIAAAMGGVSAEASVNSSSMESVTIAEAPSADQKKPTPPVNMVDSTTDVHMSSESGDDDDEDDNQASAFDLNAMLSAAMQQAVAERDGTAGASGSAVPLLSGVTATSPPQDQLMEQQHEDDEDNDDDEDEDDDQPFDFDAQIQAAMAGVGDTAQSKKRALDSDSDSDEDEEDELAFDLDAQIGAAMGGLRDISASLDDIADDMMHADTALAATVSDVNMASLVDGVTTDDLQAMLRDAMQQAAMEVELEQGHFQPSTSALTIEELIAEQSKQDHVRAQLALDPDDDFDYAEDDNNYFQDPLHGAGWEFVMADKPKVRRSLEDDGDPNNVFNRIRNWHGHALPNFYACDFQGCDRVVSSLQVSCFASQY